MSTISACSANTGTTQIMRCSRPGCGWLVGWLGWLLEPGPMDAKQLVQPGWLRGILFFRATSRGTYISSVIQLKKSFCMSSMHPNTSAKCRGQMTRGFNSNPRTIVGSIASICDVDARDGSHPRMFTGKLLLIWLQVVLPIQSLVNSFRSNLDPALLMF